MAPKRRSVVKTRVVKETVEVTAAIVADGERPPKEAPAALVPPTVVDLSGSGSRSRVVHVEVTTPDAAKQAAAGKRGRGRREDEQPPPAPEAAHEPPPVPQSQETQDPNEQDDNGDATKKRNPPPPPPPPQDEEDEPEAPRVASERRQTAAAKTTPAQRRKGKAKAGRRRRRLGEASRGGDAATGGAGGYKRYVWRVLKQVHPELGASGLGMRVLDAMMADMFERLADEAARLSKASGKATLSSREVQSAVRLVLPGELGRHAMSEGTKAISKYMSYGDTPPS
ncbi:unnamed protein product [Urochloa decumbens]|uniref:Core Histone H2A/H2B/H3 domain-containing protein n=1 Tax=Urochloa decumbens TaxID=240449 RepID=A0ABC9FIK3_9POAL